MKKADFLVPIACNFMFLVVAALAFSNNRGLLFSGLDGNYLLTLARFQFDWLPIAFGFFANPLQGMGDMSFAFNAWLHPGYLFPYLFLGMPKTFGVAYEVAVYVTHAICCFLSTQIFLRRIGVPSTTAILSCWLLSLLALPFFGSAIVFPIMNVQPNIIMTLSLFQLMTAMFLHVGSQQQKGAYRFTQNLSLMLVILVIAVILILSGPGAIFFCLPFIFIALGSIVASKTANERKWKIFAAVCIPLILIVSGFAQFTLGIFEFSVPFMFPDELENNRPSWYFVSIIFQKDTHGLSGLIFGFLGIAGLFCGAFANNRQMACIARACLLFLAFNFIAGSLTIFYDFWRGPSPVYLEVMFWPIYSAFGLRLIIILLNELRKIIFLAANTRWKPILLLSGPLSLNGLISVITVGASFSLSAGVATTTTAFQYPSSKPPMVQALQSKIGLSLGSPIKGRVAFMPFQLSDDPVSWPDLHYRDWIRSRISGNDHHTIGLWQYAIPTLLEYAPTLSPTLFLTATSLLGRPNDLQHRNNLVLRKINPNALISLGITHIITDAPQPPPFKLVQSQQFENNETLFLFELPDAIGGWATPTKINFVGSINNAIDHLDDHNFDVKNDLVLINGEIPDYAIQKITPAEQVKIKFVGHGLSVSAQSQTRSVLVFPVLFSKCLDFNMTEDKGATNYLRLIRVNALQTGIVFSGSLEGTLRYFTGPFLNAGCRREDLRDLVLMLSGK